MEYLSNQTIAKIIEDKLNDYSDLLFSNELITEKIRVRITDDIQTYSKNTKYEGLKYTPGIFQMVAPRMPEHSFAGMLAEDYVVTFYGVIRQRDDIQKLINYYVRVENDERIFTHSGWTITKTIQKPRFIESQEYNEGKPEKSFVLTMSINWQYVLGGVTGRDTRITVDGVICDHFSVSYRNDKSLLPNIAYGTNNNDKLVSEQMTIYFPIQEANAKNQELLAEVRNISFNKTHVIAEKIGNNEVTRTLVTRTGTLAYNNTNEIIGFTVLFQKALPRIPILIDGINIYVGAFSIDMEKGVEVVPDVAVTGVSVNAIPVRIGRSISITFILDGSAKVNELADDVAEDQMMKKKYTIQHSVAGKNRTYTMFMQKGHYRFTENAGLTLECIFAGAA